MASAREEQIAAEHGADALRFTQWAVAHAGEAITIGEGGATEMPATLLGWHLNEHERSICAVFLRRDLPMVGEVTLTHYSNVKEYDACGSVQQARDLLDTAARAEPSGLTEQDELVLTELLLEGACCGCCI